MCVFCSCKTERQVVLVSFVLQDKKITELVLEWQMKHVMFKMLYASSLLPLKRKFFVLRRQNQDVRRQTDGIKQQVTTTIPPLLQISTCLPYYLILTDWLLKRKRKGQRRWWGEANTSGLTPVCVPVRRNAMLHMMKVMVVLVVAYYSENVFLLLVQCNIQLYI